MLKATGSDFAPGGLFITFTTRTSVLQILGTGSAIESAQGYKGIIGYNFFHTVYINEGFVLVTFTTL